ncbi:hypothetical protein Tco_0859962 [Tanacetum coccineum]|uniref:Uncharacterized protein n=1 Tax=Tanacetum coccineum TaxID=301880 RepID=A0ABQ5BDK2_9ASTR
METKDTLSSCSNSKEQQMQQIQDKAKESCMVSFRKLHSHLKHLSHDNLKGTRIESGFKRAFATLFGQDVETFLFIKHGPRHLLEPALQPRRNQSVVRQPTAFKSERPRFSKQRYSSNDMVHKHYLEEAKKKTQESSRNSEPSVMPSARSQSTANGSKPLGSITKSLGIGLHLRVVASRQRLCLSVVPTGKIFTSSTTKVDSEPQNGSNADITNQYESAQTLDVSAGTSNLSAAMTSVHNSSGLAPPRQMTSDHNSSELGIHDHSNELSSSKLVPKVVPLADKTATSRQELELLFHHHITMLRSYALSWKPCQGDSLNLPDHRWRWYLILVEVGFITTSQLKTTKTYYKHQDSRIMKAQELKTKTSAQTLIYKIFLQRYQVYQGRLLASFQDDAKYEHVGQDTRSQSGKDDQDKRIKI